MIKNLLLAVCVMFVTFSGSLGLAAADTTKCQIQKGVNIAANGKNDCNQTTSPQAFNNILKSILVLISMVAGAAAVVMLIIGGFRYIVSAGNETAVGEARKTIIYAIVGLIIVAVSQVLVHYVLNALSHA
jgi:hypothetical protein